MRYQLIRWNFSLCVLCMCNPHAVSYIRQPNEISQKEKRKKKQSFTIWLMWTTFSSPFVRQCGPITTCTHFGSLYGRNKLMQFYEHTASNSFNINVGFFISIIGSLLCVCVLHCCWVWVAYFSQYMLCNAHWAPHNYWDSRFKSYGNDMLQQRHTARIFTFFVFDVYSPYRVIQNLVRLTLFNKL